MPRRVLRRVLPVVFLVAAIAVVLFPGALDVENRLPFVTWVALRPAEATGLIFVALLVIAIKRRWWPPALAVIVLAALTLGFVVTSRALPASPSPSSGPTLTLLSFNVDNGHADTTALAHERMQERPDIVVLPEAGERYRELIMSKVGNLNYRSWTTGRAGDEDVNGIVVLAARRLGELTAEPLTEGAKFRWMRLSGGALANIDVVAVHTAAPVLGWTRQWITDMTRFRQWCTPGHGAHVLIGDFNATLDHQLFRSSVTGCTDAAANQGQGVTATWPSYLPRWFGVQIDHVLVTPKLQPHAIQILDLPGSDHRALLARLNISGNHVLDRK